MSFYSNWFQSKNNILTNEVSELRTVLSNIYLGRNQEYVTEHIPMVLTGGQFDISNPESIPAFATCVKILSETISRLPINIYQKTPNGKVLDTNDYRYNLLHYSPNQYTNSFKFFAAVERNRACKGNSLAFIKRNRGTGLIEDFAIVDPKTVKSYKILNNKLYFIIKDDDGNEDSYLSDDVLHFSWPTTTGVWADNPAINLKANLETSFSAYNSINNFYKNNIMSPKVLTSTVGGINANKMQEALDDLNVKLGGQLYAGKLWALPVNTDIKELKMQFADAQLLETIKENAVVIASYFGLTPFMVGDHETAKFSSLEEMQQNFKLNTVDPIIQMYESELESKLLSLEERINGKTIEFDTSPLIELDSDARMTYYKALFGMGVITPNQIAMKEGLPTYPEGDKHYLMLNEGAIDTTKDASTLTL
jgi:HK97 family phage portal protein